MDGNDVLFNLRLLLARVEQFVNPLLLISKAVRFVGRRLGGPVGNRLLLSLDRLQLCNPLFAVRNRLEVSSVAGLPDLLFDTSDVALDSQHRFGGTSAVSVAAKLCLNAGLLDQLIRHAAIRVCLALRLLGSLACLFLNFAEGFDLLFVFGSGKGNASGILLGV